MTGTGAYTLGALLRKGCSYVEVLAFARMTGSEENDREEKGMTGRGAGAHALGAGALALGKAAGGAYDGEALTSAAGRSLESGVSVIPHGRRL